MSHSQFHCIELFILRHAWLNLWDKHMTTGRINQVSHYFHHWYASINATSISHHPPSFHKLTARECTTIIRFTDPSINAAQNVKNNTSLAMQTISTIKSLEPRMNRNNNGLSRKTEPSALLIHQHLFVLTASNTIQGDHISPLPFIASSRRQRIPSDPTIHIPTPSNNIKTEHEWTASHSKPGLQITNWKEPESSSIVSSLSSKNTI